MPEVSPVQMSATGMSLTEIQSLRVLRIRSWITEASEEEKSYQLAGLVLPTEAGPTVPGPMRALFIAPGEWLVVIPKLLLPSLVDEMATVATLSGFASVDLTEGLTILELRGPNARQVLTSGCGLDLHPSEFRPGKNARTRLAQVAVLIDCRADDCYELYVARSLTDYLRSWLADVRN